MMTNLERLVVRNHEEIKNRYRMSTCGEPEDSHVVVVSSKTPDIVLDPLEEKGLIM